MVVNFHKRRPVMPWDQRLEKMLRPEAEKREKAGKRPSGNLPQGAQGKPRDTVGSAVGMSGRTYEKAKAVVAAAKADPGLVSIAEEMDRTGNVEKAFRARH